METPDEPLQAIFASHVDTVYRALDLLYPAIHAAVDALCATMLDERRVLVCGSGTGTAVGQAFCASLMNRTLIDRPGLPVIGIGTEPATSSAIADSYGASECLPRPGALRVTPTRRLAHYLRRRFDDDCQARGLEVWRSPDIVTWGELVERLFDRDRHAGRLQGRWLTDDAARLVWERIVRRDPATADLVSPGSLARAAHQSWRRMHAYDIPRERLATDDSPEAAAFARWAAQYESWLSEHDWVDSAQVVPRLGVPEAGTALELVGFDTLTPAQSAFVHRLEEAGTRVSIASPAPRAGETCWIECLDRAAEWESAARWAAQRLEQAPGARLGIVIPALRQRRNEVRRVIERVLAPQT